MCDWSFFFFQAEDGIRDLVRSRGLGDVYKRQARASADHVGFGNADFHEPIGKRLLEQADAGGALDLSLIHI